VGRLLARRPHGAPQLASFLRALTGDNVDALVADAFAVPVGNPGSQ